MEAKYKRVLLKISGEALAGDDHFGINEEMLKKVALQVKEITEMGVQVAVVVGGGNFWRGRTSKSMDRATADYMGMLATVMNAMALQDAFEAEDLPTRVQTAIEMREVAEPYVRPSAIWITVKWLFLEQEQVTRFSPQIRQQLCVQRKSMRKSSCWLRRWMRYIPTIRKPIRTLSAMNL